MIAVIGGAITSVRVKMAPVRDGEKKMGTGLGQELYGEMDREMAQGMYGEFPQMPQMPQMPEQGMSAGKEQAAEQEALIYDDIKVESCGCGFNIAKILAGEGQDVTFVSVVGKDPMGLAVIEELRENGVDTSGVKKLDGTTPIQMEMVNILDDVEDLKCNDSLFFDFVPEIIEESAHILDKADIIVMDGSIPDETIAKVAQLYGDKEGVKLFFDPGAKRNGKKISSVFDKIYCVMPGRMEAEAMTEKMILDQDQLMEAGAFLNEKGVNKIIITMKGGGLYYKEGFDEGVLRPEKVHSFARTAGAGDVVSAAVIMGELQGKKLADAAADAMEKAAEFLADCSDERPIDIYNR